jgi:hypothetical protein
MRHFFEPESAFSRSNDLILELPRYGFDGIIPLFRA